MRLILLSAILGSHRTGLSRMPGIVPLSGAGVREFSAAPAFKQVNSLSCLIIYLILDKIFIMIKFLIVICMFPIMLYAQEPCGTDLLYFNKLAKYPELSKKRSELNNFTQSFDLSKSAGSVKIIPVVFHIIHNYGSENISRAQVLDALNIINEDFRKLNADTSQIVPAFQSIAADCEIEFRLANIDPFGNCTDGITRTVSVLTNLANDNVKALISWPNDKYLNIWVVKTILFGSLFIGGYATYPGTAAPGYDGIVIRDAQTGGIGTSDGSNFSKRTLTHEVGHYLNLIHTWGDSAGCGLLINCIYDDYVLDTPNTIGDYQGCNLSADTCGSGIANTQNYMDYADCTKMFTQGQKVRMHAALNSGIGDRDNLWQPSNLIATGTDSPNPLICIPIPDFKPDGNFLCVGDEMQFTDYTWGALVDTYNWYFPGGTPSSSNLANPLITYNTEGIYSVSLVVSNSAGSDTLTIDSLITIRPSTADYLIFESEGFEDAVFPPYNSFVINEAGNGWQRTTNTSFSDSSCMFINNHNGNVYDTKDIFITGGFDIGNIFGALLKFQIAYARNIIADNGYLTIYGSANCGQSWVQIYSKHSSQLVTISSYVGFYWIPSLNQWREEIIDISQFFNISTNNLTFKFEYLHQGGNNLYIDDIMIDGLVATSNNTLSTLINIYPNPSNSEFRIDFKLKEEENIMITYSDIKGSKKNIVVNENLPVGDHIFTIDNIKNSGVYIIEMKVGEFKYIDRVIVIK